MRAKQPADCPLRGRAPPPEPFPAPPGQWSAEAGDWRLASGRPLPHARITEGQEAVASAMGATRTDTALNRRSGARQPRGGKRLFSTIPTERLVERRSTISIAEQCQVEPSSAVLFRRKNPIFHRVISVLHAAIGRGVPKRFFMSYNANCGTDWGTTWHGAD